MLIKINDARMPYSSKDFHITNDFYITIKNNREILINFLFKYKKVSKKLTFKEMICGLYIFKRPALSVKTFSPIPLTFIKSSIDLNDPTCLRYAKIACAFFMTNSF